MRLDFAYPVERLGLELDGRRWHASRADRERDRSKANLLGALGWRLLRFDWSDVHDHGDEVLRLVAGLACAEGA